MEQIKLALLEAEGWPLRPSIDRWAMAPDGLLDIFHVTAQAVIAGANMVLVDVHPTPAEALCDGPQALLPEELERLCDDFGLDTIEMGVTLGVLMEGGAIPWGDGQAAIKMLKKVAKNDAWGLIIGNGSVFTGRALGVDRVPAVKGQGLPAYASAFWDLPVRGIIKVSSDRFLISRYEAKPWPIGAEGELSNGPTVQDVPNENDGETLP